MVCRQEIHGWCRTGGHGVHQLPHSARLRNDATFGARAVTRSKQLVLNDLEVRRRQACNTRAEVVLQLTAAWRRRVRRHDDDGTICEGVLHGTAVATNDVAELRW